MNFKTAKPYYAEASRIPIAYLFCSDTLLKNDLLPASKDIKYHIIIIRAQVYDHFSGVW